MISSKQGQVQTLAPAIIALIFGGIVLILGLVMTQELRDTDIVTQSQSATVTNETVTSVIEAGQNVAQVGHSGANSFASVAVYNSSGGEVLTVANYTLSTAGSFSIVTGSEYNNTHLNITYTYLHGGEAYEGSNATLVGLASFADFWEIIVLAVVISVVIGLLLVVFGGRKKR